MSLEGEKVTNISSTEKVPPDKKPFRKQGNYVSILGLIVVILLAATALIFKDTLGKFEQYGYLGTFLINIAGGATIIVPIPALAVVFTMGGILNPLFVGLAAGVGEAIGALITYMAGYGGHSALLKRQERIYDQVQAWVKQRGTLMLFVSSSILNPFFTFISVAAGALRVPIWKFFLACWAGKTIKGLSVAYLGHWGLRFIFQRLGIPL